MQQGSNTRGGSSSGRTRTRTICWGRGRRCRRSETLGWGVRALRGSQGPAGASGSAIAECALLSRHARCRQCRGGGPGCGRRAGAPPSPQPKKEGEKRPQARTHQGTDGVRTRDLRFTRPTPYHLATAPALRTPPDAFLSLAPLPRTRPRPALARACAATCRGRAALRR